MAKTQSRGDSGKREARRYWSVDVVVNSLLFVEHAIRR